MLKKPLESVTSIAGLVRKQMAYRADVAKSSVIDATLGAKDAAVEAVVRQAGKVVDLGQSVFKIPYIEFPLSIAFTVAPVPVAVGCGLMLLMDWKLHGAQEQVEDAHTEAKKSRRFDRTVALLQNHGRVPETAVVETEHIRLEVSSTSILVTGLVKTGWYAGRCVSTLDETDLNQLIVMSSDPDTLEILRAYRKLRSKMRHHQGDNQ